MALQSNPQLELAFEYVNATNKNIFLTGKAGTGKTTFLHQIREQLAKRMAVVAPTGVAAINAGGMTIHSLFQLPFGPYLPGSTRDTARQRKFTREKIRLIRSLDLLVIDEISMVRADMLDGIDDVLRRYKNFTQPFGGVQLLMIGDLHQLPPVVKEEDWMLLRSYYQTPYFFSSRALQQSDPVVIELKHIYRQSDNTFIDLLNKVRNNRIDAEVLDTLNSRYIPGFQPAEDDAFITLTTHNVTAQEINAQRLAALAGAVQAYPAKIDGEFPAQAYPADENLEVKEGAQVMFVKNDTAREKRYYNGKIGRITQIEDGMIYVQCPDDDEEIPVSPVDWENIKYTLNEKTKEVTESLLGTFTQYPLRLAWAITIHKSQGLTFDRVILDAQAAFAHGQVYVALSRCKRFDGIVLRSKIIPASVRTDPQVQHFSEDAEKNAPDVVHLEESKKTFQQALILEMFDFSNWVKSLEKLRRILLEQEASLQPEAIQHVKTLQADVEQELLPVVQTFRRQLMQLFQEPGLPEANDALQERIRKAGTWFFDKLDTGFLPAAQKIPIVTDNKAVRQAASEALAVLQQEIFVKKACFADARTAFSAQVYLRTKANAELDFQAVQQKQKVRSGEVSDSPHPKLLSRLLAWRAEMADQHDVERYAVLPTRTILEIIRLLPADMAALKKVKGIGKVKSQQFGADLIEMVRTYCAEYRIPNTPVPMEEPVEEKPPKPDTKAITLELYRSGKTIDAIAAERGFVPSTIEKHLAHFVALGELDISAFVAPEAVSELEAFFVDHNTAAAGVAKAHFGDKYSYGEIQMVLQYLAGRHADE
ncbi:MAG: helicase [Bacteroidetes bacterium]|nr:MAG: helicase [Bacteroidota bacterium]